MIKKIFSKYFELTFWIAALIALAASDPASTSHFTLCPLKLAGITWCPGCGMGHSLAYLLHGDIKNSFYQHWLGVPALIVIVYRIYTLGRAAVTPRLRFAGRPSLPQAGKRVGSLSINPSLRRRRREGDQAQR